MFPVDLRWYFVFHMLLRQHLLKRLCDTFISRSEIIVAGEAFSDFCFPFLLRYAFLRFVNLSFLRTVDNFVDSGITFTVLGVPPLFSVLITLPILQFTSYWLLSAIISFFFLSSNF